MMATTHRGILGIDRETGEDIFRANLITPFFLTQRVAKEMQQAQIEGSIIFLVSQPDHLRSLDPTSDSTSAAVSTLTRDLALDLADHGIRVNAVAFGPVTPNNKPNAIPDSLVPLGVRPLLRALQGERKRQVCGSIFRQEPALCGRDP